MKRWTDFILWLCLLVSGAWSTVIVAGVAVGTVAYIIAVRSDVAVASSLSRTIGYQAGRLSMLVALLTAVVGVPILARRHRAGFWRGLLAVALALGWLALPFLALLILLGPALGILVVTGLNFLIAVTLAVVLYRRRRTGRREPPDIADVFS